LVGLSRHADHHAFANRPFQQLRHWTESPKLPRGYPGMTRLVLGHNRQFREQMTEALRRAKLGPFSEQADPASPLDEGLTPNEGLTPVAP
jgi:alkane 1-monooxygenase